MTPYEQVLQILRTTYGWTADEAPRPEETEAALADATPEQVAARLDGWVRDKAANMSAPYGYPVQGPEGSYLHLRYRTFNGGEMWGRKTAVALGGVDDVTPDTIGEAKTIAQWEERLLLCRNRLGEHAGSQADYDRRFAAGRIVPPEWQHSEEMARLYQLLVWEGYNLPPAASVKGVSRQEHLENLRCADRGWPPAWNSKRPSSKVPA